MRDFRTLSVWQKSHLLALSIYNSTASFPKEELHGLISQMRRSVSSIPTNLAEGCGRNSQSEFAHFANMAMGSASELEYQLILAKDLGFVTDQIFKEQSNKVTEIKNMLTSLHQKVLADS
ncbi:four helix bundle protein [Gracilimonas sp.]|uniref:four helix bundle protein n=1 Tax=Gracilimonas sp. TaxID=1974203 RepID=UPI0032EF6F47